MDDRYYQLTIRVPKPHRGWLRFKLQSMLIVVTVICLLLAFDGSLLMPWTVEAMRRQQLRQFGAFEYLRTMNRAQVVSALGPPDSIESPGKGFCDVYAWQASFGVPPFASDYRLGVAFSSGGEVAAGGLMVNDEPVRP